jgi:glycosyltransferase involved in cell wall biosynthesis
MALRALIITYYWPPAGGSGVQRWLYFVKYLREFGIEPVVFTVDKPSYPIVDKSLESHIPEGIEVIRQRIWEPGNLVAKKGNDSSGFLPENPTLFQKFKQYIRANYFIPDARKFWIRPSTRKIIKYLKKNPVDWIITTGPPHSVHLIGKRVKAKMGVKWLADFRDPWTEIDYFHHLPLTKSSLFKHQRLEYEVVSSADKVIVVSNTMKKQFEELNPNCTVITNGYDDANLSTVPEIDKQFTLTHIGMLNADRNPEMLWEVLAEMIYDNEEFEEKVQINLVGHIADEVRQSIRSFELERFVNYTQYIPNYAVPAFQMKSQVLLLIINNVPSSKTIITGKVYEYLRSKRPILAIAPTDGDLADIIDTTQSGIVVDFIDKEGLKRAIEIYFKHYLKNQLIIKSINTEQYHRKNLTQHLALLLKNE